MLSAREMENKDYTDLDVWKEARKLVFGIYSLVKSFPEDEKYALTSQLKELQYQFPQILQKELVGSTKTRGFNFYIFQEDHYMK